MTDDVAGNRERLKGEFLAEYEAVPGRPSLANMQVDVRVRPDGLTVHEIRVKLKARKGGRGAKPPVAPLTP